jgi:hypothetical protein
MADELSTDQYEADTRLHEAIASFEQARDAGQDPKPKEWLGRYPEVASQLANFFADHEHFRQLAGSLLSPPGEPEVIPEVPGYQVLGLIGRGGMGVVYKARQLSADRIVALKVIRPDRLEGLFPEERRKTVERFITEALAESIREFGFRQPIVVDENKVIVVGDTRYKAALKLGLERVPVHVATGLSPAQIKATGGKLTPCTAMVQLWLVEAP